MAQEAPATLAQVDRCIRVLGVAHTRAPAVADQAKARRR